MTNAVHTVFLLDSLGRLLLEALFIPSLEAILLGGVVWLLIRFYGEPAPRVRHVLWLLVILKPLLSLVTPWQGVLPLPIRSFESNTPISALPFEGIVATSGDLISPYAIGAVFWALSVVIGIAWTVIENVRLYRRSQQTMEIPVPWVQALFSRCHTIVGVKRRVDLRMSDEFASPTLISLGRPMVVIPSWLLIQLSPQELKQVFLHELLHYSRRDHLTLFLVQIAKICFFFHPVIWFVSRRIGVEAERACDLAVVKVAQKPNSYASSLLKVAEGSLSSHWHGILELARSASTAATRIREILAGFDNRMYAIGPRTILALGLCSLLSVTPLLRLTVQPALVADVAMPALNIIARSNPSDEVAAPAATVSKGAFVSEDVTTTPVVETTDALPISELGTASKTEPLTVWPLLYVSRNRDVFPTRMPELPDAASSPVLDPGTLGLAKPSPAPKSNTNRTLRWEPGALEVESVGQTSSNPGTPGLISVRTGIFLTRAHELGGIVSVVSTQGRLTGESNNEANTLGTTSPATRVRPLSILSETGSFSTDLPAGTDKTTDTSVDQTLRLGGFYRYNITSLSDAFTPFLTAGAGVEIRPGHDPLLINGGGGVRCFIAHRAALVVQVDYMKEVALTPRSHISGSLGFSTIF